MDTQPPSSCIILLCGIPASGKTQYASVLLKCINRLEEASEPFFTAFGKVPSFSACILEFDDYLHQSLSKNQGSFSPELWHESRRLAHQNLEDKLMQASSSSTALQKDFHVIIVEDTMQYRTMRMKIFQLATKYKASFVQIALSTQKEICLQRNSERPLERRVKNEVISSMVFEVPGSSSHWWDINAIVIDNDVEVDGSGIEERIPWKTIAEGITIPLPSPPVTTHLQQSQQPSFLQELEKACRKEIGRFLVLDEMRKFGSELSKFKSQFITSTKDSLRSGMNLSPSPLEFSDLIDDLILKFRMALITQFGGLNPTVVL